MTRDFDYPHFQVMACRELMQQMFDAQVDWLTELLHDFGVSLAVDGESLPSFVRGKPEAPTDAKHPD